VRSLGGVIVALVLAGCVTPPPDPPFEARLLRGHETAATAVAISKDGRVVVSGDLEGELRVWDLEHDRELVLQQGSVRSIAFDPNDAAFATGGDNGSVTFHDAIVLTENSSGVATRALAGTRGATRNVRFNPSGSLLLSWDTDAIAWDLKTFEPRARIQGEVLAVSQDARLLVVRREGVRAFDTASGAELWHSPNAAERAAFSEDGRLLALGAKDGRLAVLDATSGQEFATLGLAGAVRSLLFSPDGKVLVVSSDGESAARVLEVPGLREMYRLAWSNDAHAFSPDSTKLVSVVGTTWLVVTDVAKGHEVASLWAGERLGPFSLHFSPGGRFLISETGGAEGGTRFFDAKTWTRLAAVEGTRVVFSKDGKRAAWSRGADGVVCVGDAPP
jgi:WD40 repeat protein